MRTPVAIAICSIGFAVGMLLGVQGARADNCDVASDAAIAQAKVPHAVLHVMTKPGEPTSTFNMIFTGDKAYMQMDGNWQAVPFSADQQIAMITAGKARQQDVPHTCEKLPGQPINGEPATLYDMRSTKGGDTSEGRFWISDKTGLPLRSELSIGDGTIIKDDFSYNNIKAPTGVK